MIAELLVEEWLNLWPERYVKRKAQDIRKVNNTVRDLMETVKYGSKIFTEPDVNKKSKSKKTPGTYMFQPWIIFLQR